MGMHVYKLILCLGRKIRLLEYGLCIDNQNSCEAISYILGKTIQLYVLHYAFLITKSGLNKFPLWCMHQIKI